MYRYCGQRLETIIKLTETCDTVADIGCDHGYIARELLERNISKKVIAVDISEKSLLKAKELQIYKNEDQSIEFRAGDGLSVLKDDEINGIIIAGLGAREIVDIIKKDFSKAKQANYFVLCPHKNTNELRLFLALNGFFIINELLAFDNDRFYECIKAKWNGGIREIAELESEIGEYFIKNNDRLLKNFIKYKIAKLNNILDNVDNINKYPKLQKKEYLRNKLEEMIECL